MNELTQDVEGAIALRLQTLTEKAGQHNKSADAARLASIGCFVVSVGAGPILAPFAAVGLAAYGLTVAYDWMQTGEFIPLPFIRKPLGVEGEATDPFLQVSFGLTPVERVEFQLLSLHAREIGHFLRRIGPSERPVLYQRMIQEAVGRGVLPRELQAIRATIDEPPRQVEKYPTALIEPAHEVPKTVIYEAVAQPKPVTTLQTETVIQPRETAYLNNLIEYPSLIFGGMGAGKSWTARYIAKLKVDAGHQVIVLDPHAASHEWLGVTAIGSGMNYSAIAEFLDWYLGEIQRRYEDFNRSGKSEELWQQSLRKDGQVISVICEEMTSWADRLPNGLAGQFFKSAMTDSRKVLMPPLFIAHNRTMTSLGDTKGLAGLRDAALLELELVATIDPETFKPVSSGCGRLKMPGQLQLIEVQLPRIQIKVTDFRKPGYSSVSPQSVKAVKPEFIAVTEVNRPNQPNQLANRPNQFANQLANQPNHDPNFLTKEGITELLNQGVSRSRIVKEFMGCKGANYQKGLQRLEKILGE